MLFEKGLKEQFEFFAENLTHQGGAVHYSLYVSEVNTFMTFPNANDPLVFSRILLLFLSFKMTCVIIGFMSCKTVNKM